MGIKRVKGGYKVRSYTTGRIHRDSEGGIKIYKNKTRAQKAAGLGRGRKTYHRRY